MPVVWGNHDNKQIFLNVALLGEPDALLVLQGANVPNIKMFKALVDTGATKTCITAAAASKLGLAPIGKVLVQGVSGIQHHNNYLFYVGFALAVPPPIAPQPAVPGTPQQMAVELNLLPTPIEGAEIYAGTNFEVLLGMDVIATGVLTVGNNVFNWAW